MSFKITVGYDDDDDDEKIVSDVISSEIEKRRCQSRFLDFGKKICGTG